MQTQKKQLTKESLQKMIQSEQCIEAAETLLRAKAYYETVYNRIRPLQIEILKKHQFPVCQEWIDRGMNHKIITDPKELHLISDENFKIYQKEAHQMYLDEGFNVKFDQCPILIADSRRIEAEKWFCQMLEPYTGISHFQLCCNGLEKLHKYIDLNLSLLVPYTRTKELFHNS